MLRYLARGYTTNLQDVLCIGLGVGIVPSAAGVARRLKTARCARRAKRGWRGVWDEFRNWLTSAFALRFGVTDFTDD